MTITKTFLRRSAQAFMVGALMFGSCTDLEETPFADIPESEFGQTEEQFIAALGAGYTSLYNIMGGHGGLWSINQVSSDETVIPHRGADWFDGGIWLRTHTHEWTVDEPQFNQAWNQCFTGVATCNRLIETLADLNPDLAPPFVNELRGLRALYYYWLIDNFGNVPIVTEFANADPTPASNTRQEVYDFLVSELNEIIPTLDQGVTPATYARINANTARMILAKIYLNAEVYTGTARWSEANDVLDDIIETGAYSLTPSYFENFNAKNGPDVKETIFAIPYDEVFAGGFNLAMMTNHYVAQETFAFTAQPWNGYASLAEFYDSYEDTDLRKGEFGNQSTPGNFLAGPMYGPDGVTPLTDPSAADPDGLEVVHTPELNELQPNCYRQAGARIYKFTFENGAGPNLNNDFPIFRYADVLLMKAEAMWQMDNGSDDALDLVNEIRSRAGVDDYDSLDADALLAERGREMFAEMYRRSDLVRFGQFTSGEWFAKSSSDDFRNLFPVPAVQRQSNPNLTQNTGY